MKNLLRCDLFFHAKLRNTDHDGLYILFRMLMTTQTQQCTVGDVQLFSHFFEEK